MFWSVRGYRFLELLQGCPRCLGAARTHGGKGFARRDAARIRRRGRPRYEFPIPCSGTGDWKVTRTRRLESLRYGFSGTSTPHVVPYKTGVASKSSPLPERCSLKKRGRKWLNEADGATPSAARGTRALPCAAVCRRQAILRVAQNSGVQGMAMLFSNPFLFIFK
jgi:hypothetical protein